MAAATAESKNAAPQGAKRAAATEALMPRKPRQMGGAFEPEPDARRLNRRKLIWAALTVFLFANLLMFLRFFFPRALFEPKTRFKIGYPSDYGLGVDTKWQASRRIWVVRNAEGLFVILARCTHLGCTPDWKPTENKFKCPCHGSGFTSEGINFEGPAPQPLFRLGVKLDTDGQVVVDKLEQYKAPDWPHARDAWLLHV